MQLYKRLCLSVPPSVHPDTFCVCLSSSIGYRTLGKSMKVRCWKAKEIKEREKKRKEEKERKKDRVTKNDRKRKISSAGVQ